MRFISVATLLFMGVFVTMSSSLAMADRVPVSVSCEGQYFEKVLVDGEIDARAARASVTIRYGLKTFDATGRFSVLDPGRESYLITFDDDLGVMEWTATINRGAIDMKTGPVDAFQAILSCQTQSL